MGEGRGVGMGASNAPGQPLNGCESTTLAPIINTREDEIVGAFESGKGTQTSYCDIPRPRHQISAVLVVGTTCHKPSRIPPKLTSVTVR